MTTRSAIGKRSGPRRSGRLWPAKDYFWELRSEHHEEHQIDRFIDQFPAVRSLTRRVRALRKRIGADVQHDDRWIRYVDGHAALDAMRTELAFNVGVEVGAVWARADLGRRYRPRRARPTPEEQDFRRHSRGLLLETSAPATVRLAVLMELVLALAQGAPAAPLRGSRRRPAGDPWKGGRRRPATRS